MYAVIIYDADVKRIFRYHKLIKQYLYHVQNSAFEGEITAGNLKGLMREISLINKESLDSIIVYTFHNSKYVKRQSQGEKKGIDRNVV